MHALPESTSFSLTEEQVWALPVVLTLDIANRVFALGRTTGYDLIRRGEYPCPVHRVGRHYRVYKADLLEAVGLCRPAPETEEGTRLAACAA